MSWIGLRVSDLAVHSVRAAVSLDDALDLWRRVGGVALLAEFMHYRDDDVRRWIDETGALVVAFWSNVAPSDQLRYWLRERGTRVHFSGITVDYDDDPSWLPSQLRQLQCTPTDSFDVKVFATLENGWRELQKTRSVEEVALADLLAVTQEFPVLLGLDFDARNVLEVVGKFPHLAGISMDLRGSGPNAGEAQYFDMRTIADVVAKLAGG